MQSERTIPVNKDRKHRRTGLLAAALVLIAAAPAWARLGTAIQDEPDRPADTKQTEQPGEAPADSPAVLPAASADDETDPLITFSETAEPMDLTALVDLVANTLRINISVRGELRGSILFNTSQSVRKSKLLPLLDAMLEQNDFSITYDDESGFYLIQPKANVPVVFSDELATTKLIEVPSIKPSSLSDSISQVLGGQSKGVSYLDELGLIVITDTPRQIARCEQLIERVLERLDEISLTPIELRYISAPAARDRLISLVGGAQSGASNTRTNPIGRQNRRSDPQQQPGIGPTGTTIENLAERLAVDPQSNSLLFRGTGDELDRVLAYVALIDKPNKLTSQRHFVGSAARQIAQLASGRGLGEVIILEDTTTQNTGFGTGRNLQQNPLLNNQNNNTSITGPTLVVDVRHGEIVYYGTEDQQQTLAEMIETLDTESDRIVIRQYKLHHAVAEDVADVITQLLTGDRGTQQGGLLPQSRGQQNFLPQFNDRFGQGGEGEIGAFDPNRVFVVADTPNNQIIVKAPVKQQDDFEQLIERLDLRRRQVYIEALIVSVSDSDTFRFAVDAQIKAGQFVGQTNFGLTDVGDALTTPNLPLPGLGGVTASLIKNEYLPFVLTAIQNDTDAKILSRPQLLVNDNEEATIASIEQQPTTSQSQGTNTTVTSFQGFEDAGTTLTVTPGISEAGFLRLAYTVEFSNFIGTGSNGIPPPRQNQNVEGSVTMPSDTTIVVGGITVENTRNTVVSVPLLGDIPIIGPLFSDTNKSTSNTLLYIFITPRILVDPDFRDLRLITKGPYDLSGLDPKLPPLEPIAIDRFIKEE
ncbi:MAG TPA: hypothetical protein ENK11_04235 [Phycisphaerales bacterium]|nr:hypothetical protein [Phycisphaerales bacterium]